MSQALHHRYTTLAGIAINVPEVLHQQRVVVHGLGVQVVGLHLGLDVLPLLIEVDMDVLVMVPGGPGAPGAWWGA